MTHECWKPWTDQAERIMALPLAELKPLIRASLEWAEWRMGYGGLEVHATEARLFDAAHGLHQKVTKGTDDD